MPELIVPAARNGPDDSGNGGWSAGLLARHVARGPAVEVTLRSPPPLERAMAVVEAPELDAGAVRLLDGDTLVAEARPATFEPTVPAAALQIDIEQARRASARFPFANHHPFPRCCCCGTARTAGDGLGIHAGPVAGVSVQPDAAGAPVPLFAHVWTPGAEHVDGAGAAVRPEAVWCALDCPSAVPFADPRHPEVTAVLGRITVRIDAPIEAGREHVVVAWETARAGRKLQSASALVTPSGRVVAQALATWITLRS